MLESQTRVPQEGDGERRSATDAREPGPKRPAQREDVDRAEVRELAVLDVAPNLLDGIQLWSVARQSFDRHPRPLLSEILPHHAARVPTESVPDHDDVATWEVALEGAESRSAQDRCNCRAASGSSSADAGHPSGRPRPPQSTSATSCRPCGSKPAGARAGPRCGGPPVDARRHSRLRRRSRPGGAARFFYLRPAPALPLRQRPLGAPPAPPRGARASPPHAPPGAPSVGGTAACDSPRANNRAASYRRASNAAKSRRDPRLVDGIP